MSAPEPTPTETIVVDDTPAAARNPLVLVAAVLGAVVVAAAVWFFLVTPLLLGDDAGANDPVTTAPGATDDTVDQAPAPDLADEVPEVEELPLVTFEVFLARDPFEPVVPQPVAAGGGDETLTDGGQTVTDAPGTTTDGGTGDSTTGGDTGGTGDGTGGTGDGTGGTGDGTTTPPPGDGDAQQPSCRTGDEVVCDGRVVSLVEITSDSQGRLAVIQVDTTIYEVRQGDVFAREFLVQSIGADEVVLVYGDEVLRLRPGQRVLK